MNILMFIGILITVCCIVGVVSYFALNRDGDAFCFGFIIVFIVGFLYAGIPASIAEGKSPNEIEKEIVCSRQQIVTETKTVPTLPENGENKYACYSSLEQKTTYEVTKIESCSDGNIICYIKEEDGFVNPVFVLSNNIRLTSDTGGENSTPQFVKTEVYETIVLVKKPTFLENPIYSMNYEDFEVGDILYIEQNPSETTYTVILSEQDFQSLTQKTF